MQKRTGGAPAVATARAPSAAVGCNCCMKIKEKKEKKMENPQKFETNIREELGVGVGVEPERQFDKVEGSNESCS